jgi:hypothetical protein
MRIALDAVILEDGSLFGPDESGFAKHFTGYVAKEREISRRIVKSVEAGQSMERISRSLRDESAAIQANPRSFSDDPVFCTFQSIGEARGLWKRNGDGAFLRLAREMASAKPFRVRRRNSGA